MYPITTGPILRCTGEYMGKSPNATYVGARISLMEYLNTGLGMGGFGSFIILAFAWSLLWKGLALWRAARRGDTWWFIAFLVINTFGILEIIYIFGVTKAKLSDFTRSR
jgi:hypothetical protein